MTLGVESRSQSQEPRCLRILPCPSLSRLLPAMTRARRRRAWRPGSRPGRAGGRTRTGWLTCGARACRNRCWPAGRSPRRPPRSMRHKQERALNAEATALCLVTGALFPVLGYDSTLALVFSMPGLPVRPGTPVPTGPAYSKARARSGEAPARAMFEADAARGDIPAGPDGTAFGLEITQIDGTTLELFNDPLLAEEFGIPSPGAKPLLRLVGLLHSGTRRWQAAVIGRYLDGENALADGLQDAFGPGQLNLADRGFFSMDRFIRFSGTGAHLLGASRTARSPSPSRPLTC